MHGVAFKIGSFEVSSYGVMVAIGMLVGVWIASVRAKRNGIESVVIMDLTIWVVLSGIFGSRFMFIFIEEWHEVISQPFLKTLKSFVMIRSGGMSFLGALLFAVPIGTIYLRKRKLEVWKIADITAPSIAIGIAFARIGCFLKGCCFGKLCDANAFYGLEFPVGSPAHYHYHGIVTVYPTQLINSLDALVLFVVLSIWFKYRRFNGQIFSLFLLLYCMTRFMTDFLRGDSATTFFGGLFFSRLTLAQVSCIIGILLSIAMLVLLRRREHATQRK